MGSLLNHLRSSFKTKLLSEKLTFHPYMDVVATVLKNHLFQDANSLGLKVERLVSSGFVDVVVPPRKMGVDISWTPLNQVRALTRSFAPLDMVFPKGCLDLVSLFQSDASEIKSRVAGHGIFFGGGNAHDQKSGGTDSDRFNDRPSWSHSIPLLAALATLMARAEKASSKTSEKDSAENGAVKDGADEEDDGLPEEVDWVKLGAVNLPPPDQGDCQSCWAHATLGAVEALIKINTGVLPRLSVQELIDCAHRKTKRLIFKGHKYVEGSGCKGNSVVEAYRYMAFSGVVKDTDYPQRRKWFGLILGDHGICYRGELPETTWPTRIANFGFVKAESEAALKRAVARQPIVVKVDTLPPNLDNYYGGLIELEDWPLIEGHEGMHAVLVVGYGKDILGRFYWKVRNSWGISGAGGFLYLRRGVDDPNGVGGITRYGGTFPFIVDVDEDAFC